MNFLLSPPLFIFEKKGKAVGEQLEDLIMNVDTAKKNLKSVRGRVVHAIRNIPKWTNNRTLLESSKKERDTVGQALHLDLSSLKSVVQFVDELEKHVKNLFPGKKTKSRHVVLINNAGMILPERTMTADGYETHFQANYLGHFLLTQLLIKRDLLVY